jgi:hypothetical protein
MVPSDFFADATARLARRDYTLRCRDNELAILCVLMRGLEP